MEYYSSHYKSYYNHNIEYNNGTYANETVSNNEPKHIWCNLILIVKHRMSTDWCFCNGTHDIFIRIIIDREGGTLHVIMSEYSWLTQVFVTGCPPECFREGLLAKLFPTKIQLQLRVAHAFSTLLRATFNLGPQLINQIDCFVIDAQLMAQTMLKLYDGFHCFMCSLIIKLKYAKGRGWGCDSLYWNACGRFIINVM